MDEFLKLYDSLPNNAKNVFMKHVEQERKNKEHEKTKERALVWVLITIILLIIYYLLWPLLYYCYLWLSNQFQN